MKNKPFGFVAHAFDGDTCPICVADETTRRAIRADLADRVSRRLRATETLTQTTATTRLLDEVVAAIWEEAAR